MSTLYIPSAAAQTLSDALWSLARPPEVRVTGDTEFLFPWIDDLQTPSKRWLIVDTTFELLVHEA